MAEEGIGLKYKLLAFMLAISIIPLSAVSFMAISNSQSMGDQAVDSTEEMGDEAVNNIDEMGNSAISDADSMGDSALQAARNMGDESIDSLDDTGKSIIKDLTEMGNQTIENSTEILTNIVKKNLQTDANDTANNIQNYMQDRIGNILTLRYMTESKEAYEYYSENNVGQIYDPTQTSYTEDEIFNDVPMFRDIYRIDGDGNISFKVGYDVSSAYDYEDFSEEDWQDISVMDVDESVTNSTVYPDTQPDDDTEYVNYALRKAYDEISSNPEEYRDKVYFPDITVESNTGENRTSNLLMVEPRNDFANAVWMGATPTFNEGGNFNGITVANINHLQIMKLNLDFRYGESGYAILSQTNDMTEDMSLKAGSSYWDSYVTEGGEVVESETYTELPDGRTVHYNDTMDDVQLGVIAAHKATGYINDYDMTTYVPEGSPKHVYLGNEMHRGDNGMLVYDLYDIGESWGAYSPVEVTSSKTSNLQDLSIVCNAQIFEFEQPMKEISDAMDRSITETTEKTNQQIDDLNNTLSNEISDLEGSITTSKGNIQDNMENKKEETKQDISNSVDDQEDSVGESVSQLQNTVVISVVVILALVAGSAYVIADRIVSPIKELTDIADRVSQGEMDLAVEVEAKDEIGELAESFNRMINSLKVAMEALEEEM
ncbi:MAG: HAMP domain-containing protein [Thermoplasmata archaeon]